ncbi:hypothetical protein F5Y08DRAFT_332482 [Xylaria arbuscula]|nr:hypothetical protein F5Y08DRAFT_332482 [Xylaria arbuscula]
MDAASTAINKILHRGSDDGGTAPGRSADAGTTNTASLDKTTADTVEHEKIHRKHQQREQKVVDKERHQDHYKTTVQPLKERQVMPEKHQHEQADTERRYIDHRSNENDAKVMLERKQGQFKNTSEEAGTQRETVQEPTLTSEHVHHHLHETVQPVVDKETVIPSVTHKVKPVKEVHQEQTIDEGVTMNPAMSREEFERRMR